MSKYISRDEHNESLQSQMDAMSLIDTSRPELGDRITAGDGDGRESGKVIDIDGDSVTVAWDQGVTTTQPIAALADLTIHG